MEQFGSIASIQCITEHDGFEAVCLNIWVLQAAFFSYRQKYGTQDVQGQPLHEYVNSLHSSKHCYCLIFFFIDSIDSLLIGSSLAGVGDGLEGKYE